MYPKISQILFSVLIIFIYISLNSTTRDIWMTICGMYNCQGVLETCNKHSCLGNTSCWRCIKSNAGNNWEKCIQCFDDINDPESHYETMLSG